MLKRKMHFLLGMLCIAYAGQAYAMDNVVIESVDGVEFTFKQSVIELSETVRQLIEDAGIKQNIPLPNIQTKELKKIAEILNKLTDNGFFDLRTQKKPGTGSIKIIEESILSLNEQDLFDLYLAVNYMDITLILPIIIRATAKKIASSDILFSAKGNSQIKRALAEENNVYGVFGQDIVKVLTIQEIQILGWGLEGKSLDKNAQQILIKIKKRFPQVGDYILIEEEPEQFQEQKELLQQEEFLTEEFAEQNALRCLNLAYTKILSQKEINQLKVALTKYFNIILSSTQPNQAITRLDEIPGMNTELLDVIIKFMDFDEYEDLKIAIESATGNYTTVEELIQQTINTLTIDKLKDLIV